MKFMMTFGGPWVGAQYQIVTSPILRDFVLPITKFLNKKENLVFHTLVINVITLTSTEITLVFVLFELNFRGCELLSSCGTYLDFTRH